jgi:amidophosphoribosyltransferase
MMEGVPGAEPLETQILRLRRCAAPLRMTTDVEDEADTLHEECGVVAIHGHPDAARQAYLALYALQHRGQESAGIATADYKNLSNIKGMGLVADIFTDEVLAKLPGEMAIGHTRYSTTGDSALLNAQPIRVDSTKGLIAIAHNGNLVNLGNIRTRLEREGAFFQTTSDSEIIVQLIAHSHAGTLVDAIADSLSQVDGAFSIVMMTRDRVFAARDPRGFRPLSMGRIANPDGPDTIVFASETCAFDLLRAKWERDVKPGELVMVTQDGVTSRQYSTGVPQTSCIFEHVYFARPDSRIFGRWVQESRDEMGRQLARESHVDADLVVPVPDSGVTAALGYAAESGIPFNFGLIRNHYVGRTFIEPEQKVRDFGVKLKLNPVRNLLEGKRIILIDDSIIRGTTSRKIVRMVRQAGAGSPSAHQLSADDLALFLRRRYSAQAGADRGQQLNRRDTPVHRGRHDRLSYRSTASSRPATAKRTINTAPPAIPASIRRNGSMSKRSCPPPRAFDNSLLLQP